MPSRRRVLVVTDTVLFPLERVWRSHAVNLYSLENALIIGFLFKHFETGQHDIAISKLHRQIEVGDEPFNYSLQRGRQCGRGLRMHYAYEWF